MESRTRQASKDRIRQTRREIGLERRERTRQKLLAAAARVVAELGEKKATIDDFIQAAGLARGTFYNHYATRDQLLDDLWNQIGKNPFHDIQSVCGELADPAERLATEARLVLQFAAQNPTWGWLVYALSADKESINQDLLAYPRPVLDEGQRAGRFKFDELASANDLVVGAVRGAIRSILSEGRSATYPTSLCVMLLKAVGVEDEEARRIASKPLPSRESPDTFSAT